MTRTLYVVEVHKKPSQLLIYLTTRSFWQDLFPIRNCAAVKFNISRIMKLPYFGDDLKLQPDFLSDEDNLHKMFPRTF